MFWLFQNDKSKGKRGKNRLSTIERMKEEGEALLKVSKYVCVYNQITSDSKSH